MWSSNTNTNTNTNTNVIKKALIPTLVNIIGHARMVERSKQTLPFQNLAFIAIIVDVGRCQLQKVLSYFNEYEFDASTRISFSSNCYCI